MTERMRQFYYWAPRGLGILVALVLTGLALQIINANKGDSIGQSVADLVFFGVAVWLIALAIGWRWELVGLLLFTGTGVWFLVSALSAGGGADSLALILSIFAPPIVIGLLLLVDWYVRTKPIVSTRKPHDRGETLVQKK